MTTPERQQDMAVTLPVDHLSSSANFYLDALEPLGYSLVSQVRHKTPSGPSKAVGIGPANSSRVDLFLSESARVARQRSAKPAHVVFPAASRYAVREVYAAALDAGARPVQSPHLWSGGADGLFSMTVADPEGNKLEVCYTDDVARDAAATRRPGPPRSTSVDRRPPRAADSRGTPRSARAQSLERSRVYYPVAPVAAARAPSTTSSRRSGPRAGSVHRDADGQQASGTSGIQPPGGNAVIGTLIGVAAGAAVAYAVTKTTEDSKRKEQDFNGRMSAREQVKAEARASTRTEQIPIRPVSHRNSLDRDSGYGSGGSIKKDASPPSSWRKVASASSDRGGSARRAGDDTSTPKRRSESVGYSPSRSRESTITPTKVYRYKEPARKSSIRQVQIPPSPIKPPTTAETRASRRPRTGSSPDRRERTAASLDRHSTRSRASRESSSRKEKSSSSFWKRSSSHNSRHPEDDYRGSVAQSSKTGSQRTQIRSSRSLRKPPSAVESKHSSDSRRGRKEYSYTTERSTPRDEESDDGVDDATLVPDDSISCVMAPSSPPRHSAAQRSGDGRRR